MKYFLHVILVILLPFSGLSQDFNLDNWVIPKGVVVEKAEYKGKSAIEIVNSRKEKGGIVYLKDVDLSDGVMECDIASGSMVGITFRVQDESVAECIYFRPFNSGTDKHKNTVQYVARGTKFSWKYLRDNYPGNYEAGADIHNFEWFHTRIEFKDKTVVVYINNSDKPVLVVEDIKLDADSGSVGFWTWVGYYANFSASKQ